nr:ABC transporter substrate-binding protein [uncultured Cohaesibacter sp.]
MMPFSHRTITTALWLRIIALLALALLLTFVVVRHASAQDKTQLDIWGTTDTSAFERLVAAFEQANQDISVAYHEITTNALYEHVLSARDRRDTDIDLVISSAMDLQVKLVNEGLAAPFSKDRAGSTPSWAQWRNELYGFTYEPIVLVYNKKLFQGYPLPNTHADLADLLVNNLPTFEGKVGTYDAVSSGAGYLFFTQDAIQSDRIFRVIESLSRAKMRTYDYTSAILDAVASGDLILGYNVIGTYALERASQDPNLGIFQFKDYTIVMSRTAFIYKYSVKKSEAERFMEFLLSDAGQERMAEVSSLIPISPDMRRLNLPQDPTNAYLPIKMGVGLLTYQDALKKRNFLEVWQNMFEQPEEQ